MQYKYLIGIDEVGRGPLAGPVSVGVVLVSHDFDWELLPEVDDSKKLTEQKREVIYKETVNLRSKGQLYFAVGSSSASYIDTHGIVPAVSHAMELALKSVEKATVCDARSCHVKLDGSLRAPARFVYQETIIKGDAKEKVIGLASIVAKVTRDRYMKRLAQKEMYAPYAFEVHKGYGTKVHRLQILNCGLSDMHRKSFCMRLLHS